MYNREIVIGEFLWRVRKPTLWGKKRWLSEVESGAVGDVLADRNRSLVHMLVRIDDRKLR